LATPPIKLKLEQQIGGVVTKSKSPGLIIVMGQLETLSSNQIMFIALVSTGVQVNSIARPFTSPNTVIQKPFL
jgi:hypothetical protein